MEPAVSYLIWLAVTYYGVLVAKLSFTKIYYQNYPNSCWAKWVNFRQEDDLYYFQIRPNSMSTVQKVWDLLLIGIHASITFYYGNWVNRINSPLDLLFLLPYTIIIPLFGFFGQIKGMNYTISPNGLKNISLQAKTSLVLLAIMFTSLYVYHFQLATAEGIIGWYLLGVFGVPLVWYSAYFYMRAVGGQPYWHIHHYFIGWYFSTIFRFNTPTSKFFSALLYGVFIQGSMICGLSPVLTQPSMVTTEQIDFDKAFGFDDLDEDEYYRPKPVTEPKTTQPTSTEPKQTESV